MSRIDYRSWASVGLFAAVLSYVGCSSSTVPSSSTSSPTNAAKGTTVTQQALSGTGSKAQKLLADLHDPAAVLIVSGQRENHIEPCGCTQGQEGGLIRLYDFVERLHQQKWPTALIDLGSLIKDPSAARGGLDQAKIKFDYAVKALALLQYNAVALSPEDLKLGIGETLGLLDNSLGETTRIVVANVQPEKVYERRFLTSLVVSAGPVKLGITSVTDPDTLQKLADPDKGTLLPTVKQPGDVLPATFAELDAKSDYQVLMVQGPPDLAKQLAEAYPGFDIVIATSEFDDPINRDGESLNGGKTLMVTVGKKGKKVGVFGFYPDQPIRLRYHLVTLGTDYDGPATAMKELVLNEYRNTLKNFGVIDSFPRTDFANGAPGANFIGAETCKKCHPNTYMKWSTTKHFQAFNALLKDARPNTQFDAECVSCHTTGFAYNSGWRSEAKTPYLAGNQCENCHGPGSVHAAKPGDVAIRKTLALTADQADKNLFCVRCHDEENDRDFDFTKRWGEIVHKGLDTYTDPAVLRGISPSATGKK